MPAKRLRGCPYTQNSQTFSSYTLGVHLIKGCSKSRYLLSVRAVGRPSALVGVLRRGRFLFVLACFWVVFPVLFFRVVGRLWRWWSGSSGSSGSFDSPAGGWSLFPALFLVWLAVGVVLCPLFVVWAVLRRLLFVRFPRPAFWAVRGCPVWAARGWVVVPAGSLSAVRASWFVGAVRPAVVCRRSGVVLFFWAWLGSPAAPAA